MTKYSEFFNEQVVDANTHGSDAFFIPSGASANTEQHTAVGLTMSGTTTATHTADVTSSRIVQISEFVAGVSSVTNTSLDFDLIDEGKFIQEDAVNGTDFTEGVVKLYNAGGWSDAPSGSCIWDTNLNPSWLTITGGRTTSVSNATGSFSAANASHPIPVSGKTYFEIKQNSSNVEDFVFGIATELTDKSIYNLTNSIGFDYRISAGPLQSTGRLGGVGVIPIDTSGGGNDSIPIPINTIIGLVVDMDSLELFIYANNTYVGKLAIPVSSPNYHPFIWGSGALMQTTVNLHSSQLVYTPPQGARPGLQTGGDDYQINPKYITTSDQNHIPAATISSINSCSITSSTPTNTNIKALVSFDGRSTWKKYDGSWSTVSGMDFTGATVSGVETGLTALTVSGVNYLDFAFQLETTNNSFSPSLDLISLNYDEHGFYRVVNPDDYIVQFTNSTTTKVIKNTAGTSNIKVNIIL